MTNDETRKHPREPWDAESEEDEILSSECRTLEPEE